MIIVIWSGKGALGPMVAVPAGWLGAAALYFLLELIMPRSWVNSNVMWYVLLLLGFWIGGFAHFLFQSWLEDNGELDQSSFFFIPTSIWTGLLFLAPIVYIIWGLARAIFFYLAA